MAITSKIYKRPNSAASKYAFNKIIRTSQLNQVKTIIETTSTLAAVLPASQAYVSGDVYAENIVCGGTTLSIGKMVGIQLSDTKESTDCAFAVQGGPFLMKSAAAQTWNPGKEVWWKLSDGLIYSANPTGAVECGFVVTDPEGNATESNPDGLPAATYVWVVLNQIVS